MLCTHKRHKITVKDLPVDSSHVVVLRRLDKLATAKYTAIVHERGLTQSELREMVRTSEYTKKEVHHRS